MSSERTRSVPDAKQTTGEAGATNRATARHCRTVSDRLTAYLDGELDPAAASAVRGHLRLCERCRVAAEDHAKIRDALGDLERPEPPAALWDGVLDRLGQAEIADARKPRWSRWLDRVRPHLVPAGLATAACATAVLVMHLRTGDDDATRTPVAVGSSHQPDVAPPPPAPAPAPPMPPPVTRDATDALADEAARIDGRFRDTAAELLPLARAELHGAARTRFDREVAALEARVVRAAAGAARDRAWHALIRYLERAALGEPGRLAMNEVSR